MQAIMADSWWSVRVRMACLVTEEEPAPHLLWTHKVAHVMTAVTAVLCTLELARILTGARGLLLMLT